MTTSISSFSSRIRHETLSAQVGQLDPGRLAMALAELDSKQRAGLLISEIKVPGDVLLLSPALCQTLTKQGKLIHDAA